MCSVQWWDSKPYKRQSRIRIVHEKLSLRGIVYGSSVYGVRDKAELYIAHNKGKGVGLINH